MSKRNIRIATRKSPLALWQANYISQLLVRHWPDLQITLLPMLTSGDKFMKGKLQEIGGKGLFVKELEEALLDGRADIAVHSMKDVPADLPDGLEIAVINKRDNPFDAFVSDYTLDTLPLQSKVGTTSLRRQSQLLMHRPDLVIEPLRGNIQTRLEKLAQGDYHAIILAASGLMRMGLEGVISHMMDENVMLPACGQGALGVECRIDDEIIQNLLKPLHDELTSDCVKAERRVNALLGGNCHVPLAVFCSEESPGRLILRAKVLSMNGKQVIFDQQTGQQNDALVMADNCAKALLLKGARELLGLTHG